MRHPRVSALPATKKRSKTMPGKGKPIQQAAQLILRDGKHIITHGDKVGKSNVGLCPPRADNPGDYNCLSDKTEVG